MPKKAAKKTVKKTVKKTIAKVAKKTTTKTVKASTKSAKSDALVRGGKRAGAGRPKGTGKYGCATKAVRVPVGLVDDVHAYIMKKIKAAK